MGLIDVFAKFHGKEKWSELEPWQKFIVGIELMLLPITLLILGDVLAGLLGLVDSGVKESTAPAAVELFRVEP